jgi:hypothetical protein
MSVIRRTGAGKVKYPMATIAFYGPDNRRASKLVAAIYHGPDDAGPLRRWTVEAGDVRYDPTVTDEVMAFLKENQVVESVMTERIIGCPHEEGKDYPEGGVCPTCSFWWNIDRWTHQPIAGTNHSGSGEKIGRNDPCPCGSGKKYKKCCGAG